MAASPERAFVEWANGRAAITTLVSDRIATSLPAEPTLPFLVAFLAGGAPTDDETPLHLPILQVDCYGATKADMDTLYRAVTDEVEAGAHITATDGFIYGMQILGWRPQPEPNTGWHRMSMDVAVTIREVA